EAATCRGRQGRPTPSGKPARAELACASSAALQRDRRSFARLAALGLLPVPPPGRRGNRSTPHNSPSQPLSVGDHSHRRTCHLGHRSEHFTEHKLADPRTSCRALVLHSPAAPRACMGLAVVDVTRNSAIGYDFSWQSGVFSRKMPAPAVTILSVIAM